MERRTAMLMGEARSKQRPACGLADETMADLSVMFAAVTAKLRQAVAAPAVEARSAATVAPVQDAVLDCVAALEQWQVLLMLALKRCQRSRPACTGTDGQDQDPCGSGFFNGPG